MSDLLAIVGAQETDDELLEEIARRRPDRVTVLAEDRESKRAASLVGAIEQRTGAVVVGLARSRGELLGWRFDRVVGDRSPVAV
jgi:hypothetical protein